MRVCGIFLSGRECYRQIRVWLFCFEQRINSRFAKKNPNSVLSVVQNNLVRLPWGEWHQDHDLPS